MRLKVCVEFTANFLIYLEAFSLRQQLLVGYEKIFNQYKYLKKNLLISLHKIRPKTLILGKPHSCPGPSKVRPRNYSTH
jgi:hypothetical protein